VNPDTIGYVWTGEFDLNTLRVDGEIFESGKKKLQIRKYPDTCGRGQKFEAQPTNALVSQMFGGSSQLPTTAEHCVGV